MRVIEELPPVAVEQAVTDDVRLVLDDMPRVVETPSKKARERGRWVLFGAVLVVALSLTLTLVGVATGLTVQDEDEAIYVNTLRSMRTGAGYYPAMRDALVEKEGVAPSSVRAVRPPTMFLFLRLLPERAWRWAAGAVFMASLFLVWTLARKDGEWAGIVASLVAFVWLAPAAPYMFLHAELWGLPFFLAGLLMLRKGRDGPAAVFLVAATLIRELFGLSLLIALIARRRRQWAYGVAAAAVGGLFHTYLAGGVLSAAGRDAELQNVAISPSLIFQVLGPGTTALSVVVGLAVLALAVPGMLRRVRGRDAAATVLLPFMLVLAAAGIVATRLYWSITWGPAIAAFVPAGVSVLIAKPLGARASRRRALAGAAR